MIPPDSHLVLPATHPTPLLFHGGTAYRSSLRFDPTTGSRYRRRMCSMSSPVCCFGEGSWRRRRTKGGLKVEIDSGGEDVLDAGVAAESRAYPEHLVVMVNGLVGSSADWRYAAGQFVKKHPDKLVVHRSECNSSKLTFDGVDLMGERLAEEVLSLVRRRPEVRKISFVAHSLGGLIARYAVARLYEQSPKVVQSGDAMQGADKKPYEDRIAGLEPINFITFASPHLGSRGHKQFPILCGLPFLERQASQTAHLIAGRTGKHLFLTDNDHGKPPLLLRMVNDSDELKFISALCAFKRRVLYANANFDYMVGWGTSSIRRQNELPKSTALRLDEKYPHIVYIEPENTENKHDRTSSSSLVEQTMDLEEMMINGLTQVPWERIHVSFHKSRQRLTAHNTIQASEELLVELRWC
ncbi:unnamed protein product [Linum tenue]|uniref:DUF676 domain-containing protein n=1 Tax=Linum tenue TaxID=586396 RepID=A0AAV0J0H8_9ROSI|nr:unnamed protein product [Linum tenue]